MDPSQNPYAAPEAGVELSMMEPFLAESDVEQTRRKYLNHEASVKSIGLLYYLGSVFLLLCAYGGMCAFFDSIESELYTLLAVAVFYGAMSVAFIFLGTGLRRLSSWVRIPVAILSVIGLIGFPLGTIINGYILWLVLCKKGRVVFSPEYKEVIRQTPHIRYKTSMLVIILLVLLGVLILMSMLSFLLMG